MTATPPTRQQALDAALAAVAVDGPTAEDLLAAARVLDSDPFLRRGLVDPSVPVERRALVVQSLFDGKVTPAALSVIQVGVAQNWSDGHGLVRALERQGIRAVWRWADRAGILDRVTDELFDTGQLVTKTPELRRALTDFTVPTDQRRRWIQQLLGTEVAPQTLALLEHAAVTHHATFEDAIKRDLDLAGQLRNTLVAVATVAKPLSEAQRTRLTATLSRRAGRPVRVQEAIDPNVLGGVRVELGDDVIDGTLTARLGAVRRHL